MIPVPLERERERERDVGRVPLVVREISGLILCRGGNKTLEVIRDLLTTSVSARQSKLLNTRYKAKNYITKYPYKRYVDTLELNVGPFSPDWNSYPPE